MFTRRLLGFGSTGLSSAVARTVRDGCMTVLLGVFRDPARAVEVIESLRLARVDLDRVRMIGGPDHVADFAAQAGPGANVAAGPPGAVLGGLVQSELRENELAAVEERVSAGAAVLLAEDLDAEDAEQFVAQLREHQADTVIGGDTHNR